MHIDGQQVLTSSTLLTSRPSDDATSGAADLAGAGGGGGNATASDVEAAVLDSSGRAFLGFAASSGAAAFEQYEIGGWSFRHELPPSLRE